MIARRTHGPARAKDHHLGFPPSAMPPAPGFPSFRHAPGARVSGTPAPGIQGHLPYPWRQVFKGHLPACHRNSQMERVPACPSNTPGTHRMRLNARHEKFAPYAGAGARVACGHPGGRLCASRARATRLRAPARDARLRVPRAHRAPASPARGARATRDASCVTRHAPRLRHASRVTRPPQAPQTPQA